MYDTLWSGIMVDTTLHALCGELSFEYIWSGNTVISLYTLHVCVIATVLYCIVSNEYVENISYIAVHFIVAIEHNFVIFIKDVEIFTPTH